MPTWKIFLVKTNTHHVYIKFGKLFRSFVIRY